MNATFGNAIVGALARLLRPLGLGPLAGPDPELREGETRLYTHQHFLPDGFRLWHRHAMTPRWHPLNWADAHPGQNPDLAP